MPFFCLFCQHKDRPWHTTLLRRTSSLYQCTNDYWVVIIRRKAKILPCNKYLISRLTELGLRKAFRGKITFTLASFFLICALPRWQLLRFSLTFSFGLSFGLVCDQWFVHFFYLCLHPMTGIYGMQAGFTGSSRAKLQSHMNDVWMMLKLVKISTRTQNRYWILAGWWV